MNEVDIMEEEWGTTIVKMMHDTWPNVVLLKDGFWFVAGSFKQVAHEGLEGFFEFEFIDADVEFLMDTYGRAKCLNNTFCMRPYVSVNQSQIILIQQYSS